LLKKSKEVRRMNQNKYIILLLLVYLAFTMACGETLYHYYPKETLPKKIYVGNEVELLKTNVDIPLERQMYVKIRTKTGVEENGRLIRITEEDLIFALGYYYSTINDTLRRLESQKVIPKDEILILKIW
jgi:hypothetical protein